MAARGGGSGGSIVIAAGRTVKINGTLNVRGGNGGLPAHSTLSARRYGGGGSGGRIAIYGESIMIGGNASISVSGGKCLGDESNGQGICDGEDGTLYQQKNLLVEYSIDAACGAMNTSSSLHFHAHPQDTFMYLNDWLAHHRFSSGPVFDFKSEEKPERISFFQKASFNGDMRVKGWGSSLVLRSSSSTDTTLNSLCFSFGKTLRHGIISSGGKFTSVSAVAAIQDSAGTIMGTRQETTIDQHMSARDLQGQGQDTAERHSHD